MAKTSVQERPTTRAVAKYIGTSPYKVRQVVGLIRGKDAEAAQNELLLCERGPAHEVSKLLNSAIANAAHNDHIPAEELRVKEAFVDEGPTMKRFRARARGRGSRIFKRTSHITIILERMTQEDIETKAKKESGTGAANAREQRRRRAEASKAAREAREQALEDAESDDSTPSDSASSPSGQDEPKVSSLSADASEDAESSDETTEAAPKKKPAAKKAPAKKPAAEKEEKPKAEKKPAAKKPAAKKTEEKEGDA